jgi:phosphopantothenate-cysteine ligase/phosphopantothenoylcysteine decarboxylase/phosphopantothenate--cysteine ligase
MKILVTAGSTSIPIDKVRIISNIFKGKTGTDIANYFAQKHEVTLITSNDSLDRENISHIHEYKTFWELHHTMENLIKNNHYDIIIHSAAVSDYEVEGIYSKQQNNLVYVDNTSKVSSSYPELFLKLIPTPKIIDQIRPWGFKGKLIKFKLQVNITDDQLIKIAEQSRIDSKADAIVANCLEWSRDRAFIISGQNISTTNRPLLPQNLETFIRVYL